MPYCVAILAKLLAHVLPPAPVMRTLLGLFADREHGLAAVARLRALDVATRTIEDPADAAALSRESTSGAHVASSSTLSGAAVGALAGGPVGAIPGLLVGALLGRGLSELNARRYERTVAAGGIVVIAEALDIQSGAHAEDALRVSGATHVHTGEVPLA